MCDYSLMGVPNRLARDGEELVVYGFPMGSKGMTSPAEMAPHPRETTGWPLWEELKGLFRSPKPHSVPAVCIPPGAQLLLRDIPSDIQHSLCVGPVERVTFTQFDMAENRHRDAVRFADGSEISLQCLSDGQRVTVLSLGSDETNEISQGTLIRLGRF